MSMGEGQEIGDFRQTLEEQLPRLTKSEQRIASYLLVSYDEATFLSAADLSERLEVSEATIGRFAKAIGYTGFPQMRRHLQEMFRVKATPASRLSKKLTELADSEEPLLSDVIDMEMQYLAEAERSIDADKFGRAIEVVLGGKRVFAYGSGPAAVLAETLELRLRRLGILTIAMTESGRHILEKLQLLEKGDAVVATGFNYVRPELVVVLERARELGCGSVLITDTLGTVLRDYVDVVLAARRGPVATFHSHIVPMAVINALLLGVALRRSDESLGALKRLQSLRSRSGLDVPVDFSLHHLQATED